MKTSVSILALSAVLATLGCPSSGSGGGRDAAVGDTGADDVSTPDTGELDTGARDTGVVDTGTADTGAPDTGAPDTGAADTGPPPPVCGDSMCGTDEPTTCESDCDLVPAMTAATSPSGTVTWSGEYSASYEGWQVFDGATTLWISEVDVAPAWVAYEFDDGPKTVMRYGVRYANGSLTTRAPRDWQLQGWTGSSWATLDTQTAQTGWSAGEWRRFDVATPAPHAAYRLYVTDDNDAAAGIVVISIGQMQFWGI